MGAGVLIAGCGDLGCALGLQLAAEGCRVYGLRRRTAAIPSPIEPIEADLGDASTLGALPRDVDAVVYSATPGESGEAAYERAYVTGLRNLLAAMDAAPPRRLIYVSSTSVYAQSAGERVDEDSPTEPQRFSGRAVLAGERLAGRSRSAAVCVRFGGIYGPGRTRLIDRVRAGATCIETPPQYTNRIHRDDCVGVLRHLLAMEAPARCYTAVDHEPAPECEVLDWLARELGAPVPRRQSGPAGARRAGSKRVSNDRLVASGYRFRYPSYREGYAAMLEAGV